VRTEGGSKCIVLESKGKCKLLELKPFTCASTYLHGTPEFCEKLKCFPVLTK
jgi:hypothetical protein